MSYEDDDRGINPNFQPTPDHVARAYRKREHEEHLRRLKAAAATAAIARAQEDAREAELEAAAKPLLEADPAKFPCVCGASYKLAMHLATHQKKCDDFQTVKAAREDEEALNDKQ